MSNPYYRCPTEQNVSKSEVDAFISDIGFQISDMSQRITGFAAESNVVAQ